MARCIDAVVEEMDAVTELITGRLDYLTTRVQHRAEKEETPDWGDRSRGHVLVGQHFAFRAPTVVGLRQFRINISAISS